MATKDFCLWLDETATHCVSCPKDDSGYETKLKLLQCFHSCCTKCLDGKRDVVKCPVCDDETDISQGIDQLPDNVVQQSLVRILIAVTCTSCKMCPSASSDFICFECQGKTLCNACCKRHSTESVSHKPVPKERVFKFDNEGDVVEKLKKIHPAAVCPVHGSGALLDTYCSMCLELVCTKCTKDKHAGHPVQQAERLSAEYRTWFINTLLKTGKDKIQLLQRSREREREATSVQEESQKLEGLVKQRMTFMKKLVDEMGTIIMDELKSNTKSELEKKWVLSGDINRTRGCLEDLQAYASVFNKITSDADVIRHYDALSQRLTELSEHVAELLAAKDPRRNVPYIIFPSEHEVKKHLTKSLGALMGREGGSPTEGIPAEGGDQPKLILPPGTLTGRPSAKGEALYFGSQVGPLVQAIHNYALGELVELTPLDEHGDYGRYLFNAGYDAYIGINATEEICILKPDQVAIYSYMGKLKTMLFCRFSNPTHMRIRGTDIYILDQGVNRILRFTREKILVQIYELPKKLSGRLSMAVSGVGGIYLASYESSSIYFCEQSEKKFQLYLDEEKELQLTQGIYDICLAPDGGIIVAICGGFLAFTKFKELKFLFAPIDKPAMFSSICCDAFGQIYFTCGRGLDVLSPKGELITTLIKDDNIKGDIYQVALSPSGGSMAILAREQDYYSKELDYYYRLHFIQINTECAFCF